MDAIWSDDPEWIYGFGEMEEDPDDPEQVQVCEQCSHYETCDIVSDGDCPFYDPQRNSTEQRRPAPERCRRAVE